MTHQMQKKLSRRELQRRMEQGREAMRVLAAAVVEAGGRIRIKRDTYAGLPPNHKLTVTRDELTGDLLLYASVPGHDTLPVVEMTFEEIRAKYGPSKPGTEGTPEAATEGAGLPIDSPDAVPER
jgi:hypothetical protein